MDTSLASITPRGVELNASAVLPFEALDVARALLHECPVAGLSCTDPGGFPYGTVTNVVLDAEAAPIFFAAGLALHARNLQADDRISLSFSGIRQTDVLTRPRLTLVGRARPLAGDAREIAAARFLARFPKTKTYLDLPDALLFRVEVSGVQLNGGPRRNASDMTAQMLRIAPARGDLAEKEPELLQTLAQDSGLADALAGREGQWRITGLDAEGVDLVSREVCLRRWFPSRAETAQTALAALAALRQG